MSKSLPRCRVEICCISFATESPLVEMPFFWETFFHTCVDLDRPAVNLTHRWVREGKWKLIVPADSKESLNSTTSKRTQRKKRNSAASEPAVVERLKRRLETWWEGNAWRNKPIAMVVVSDRNADLVMAWKQPSVRH